MPDLNASKPPAPTRSRARLIAFRAISLCAPLLLLALLELVLRISGLGGYAPIIRPVGRIADRDLVITDPAGAASYFFANRDRPGYNEQYNFLQPKPEGIVRIVLVGESAMKGFPEPRNLAASAFLQQMLSDLLPGTNVEVINLGTTAVASFPVLDILTQALRYSPDLVIVSTGHNEFFGTYGVCSIGGGGSRPWMLKANRALRSLAIVQGLEKLLYRAGPKQNKTLMEVMIGRSYTGPRDWRRRAAARNLEHNVSQMIARCKASGVPVLVCSQPCNERDLAPMGEDRPDGLSVQARGSFTALFEQGRAALTDNPRSAEEKLTAALRLWPDNARAHYLLAQSLLAQSNAPAALNEFTRAKDLDSLPWRAPSLSQDAILRAAANAGAPIVDLVNAFRAQSPGGVVGWELMDDHVHPTLRGQALIASTIIGRLQSLSGPLHMDAQKADRLPSWEVYAARLGSNIFDTYGVAHTMRVIFGIPFMRESNPDAVVRFDKIASQIENDSNSEIRQALYEWQTVIPHAGGKRPITGMVARVLLRQNKYAEALKLFRIAERSVPEYTSWHMEYVYFALACEEKLHGRLSEFQRSEALDEIKQGQFLLKRGFSESGMAERHMARLHQLRGEFAEAIPFLLASRKKLNGNDLVAADQALAVSYLKTGQSRKARELVENGITHSGTYAGVYRKMLADLPQHESTNRPEAP